MNVKQKIVIIIFISFLGCETGPQITPENPNNNQYISGRWNDSDARNVAEEMIHDCLDRPWLFNYIKEHQGKNPTVIVGRIRNKTSEHIDVNTFVGSIQRALINSGKIHFVASQYERQEIRGERKDQAIHSSDETQKGPGLEVGADYMLKGNISSIKDQSGGTSLMYYQVNLKLINMADNRIEWVGEKRIRRKIERSRWSL
ncbi:MAG: lipoprotein [Candidatus Magnetoglobus multicellularis str. Araruama]|uniref:Lipoprotein n=1 Tax=Candidatus Magnetoglobus multicellularis str. Araruama TaxID=890399 RepID=A0A1V1PB46_9BACT|nr:MAG: lipoprotein [Candidatus Magnetoglobus multicellularis str. Araruama]